MRRASEQDGADADADAVAAWAASGAMALTGWPGAEALGPPSGLVPGVRALERSISRHRHGSGPGPRLDGLALLGERAAIAGLGRRGRTSCGGATRLVRARDRWLAVTLARDDDVELLPAWLGVEPVAPGADPWPSMTAAVAEVDAGALVEGASLLGLPVAALPDGPPDPGRATAPVAATEMAGPPPGGSITGLRVLDLGSLWAGPLAASLLAALGADVVKVESTRRPDGARRGPAPFYDLLNAGKRSVALDLGASEGQRALHELVAAADVVVEASRPRALRSLGIDAERLLATAAPRVWVSITGHGRAGPGANRVAFGDDAAVAGGLVSRDARGEPVFCADAVADPLTGLTAAAAVLDALARGGSWLLDVSMAAVAASLAGPTLPVPSGLAVAAPRARPAPRAAAALGADTAAVLRDLRDLRPRGRP